MSGKTEGNKMIGAVAEGTVTLQKGKRIQADRRERIAEQRKCSTGLCGFCIYSGESANMSLSCFIQQ